jgi:colanic acid/amylovoran biosynthesis glycosyltransferase
LLVAERDTEAIADRLNYLISHREVWQEMGQKGRKHIEEFNDLEKQNDRLIEIYRTLLEQGSTSISSLASLPSVS